MQININLIVLPVVKPKNIDTKILIKNKAFTDDGILFNSDFLNNLKVNEAIQKIIKIISKKNWVKKNYIST